MKLEELVLDFSLYPRHAGVDARTVSVMVTAYQVGATFPPIVIDRKTKRVVDGFHRSRMYKELGVEDIEVEERDYPDEAAFQIDAWVLNRDHGRPFDPFDRREATLRFERLGLSADDISSIIYMPKERITEFSGQLARRRATGEGVVIKRGLPQLHGKELTESEDKLNKSWSGQQPTFLVNQLVQMLEAGIVPSTRPFVEGMNRLVKLWPAIHGEVSRSKG